MVNTLLLDLDGTLCTMDKARFMKRYLTDMAEHFKDIIPVESFAPHIMKSSAFASSHPSPNYSWGEVFINHFAEGFGLKAHGMLGRFMDFFVKDFPQYCSMVTPHPLTVKLLQISSERGFKLACASNCLMPRIAIEERMRCCGIEPARFAFIPGMEHMHYSKPNPLFFQEIADNIGVAPADCLVVGNDLEEDMCASDIGMKTFFVGVYPEDPDHELTYAGELKDLIALLEKEEI